MDETDAEAILGLERLSFRTWPARESGRIGTWDIGATDGFTRRANSAQALGDPGLPLDEAVAGIESWYRTRNLPPCIKVSPASPPPLDALLAAKGWEVRTPATVMVLELTESVMTESVRIRVDAAPSRDWLRLSAPWEGRTSCTIPHHAALLSRIPRPGIVTLEEDGSPRGLGVCALDGNDAFLYDLVVDPARRGQGFGRTLTRGMLGWAADQGATRAVLQVLDTNAAARGLYESLGFADRHVYHYRQAPGSCGTEGCRADRSPDSRFLQVRTAPSSA